MAGRQAGSVRMAVTCRESLLPLGRLGQLAGPGAKGQGAAGSGLAARGTQGLLQFIVQLGGKLVQRPFADGAMALADP